MAMVNFGSVIYEKLLEQKKKNIEVKREYNNIG
jgi:hypothetical protein